MIADTAHKKCFYFTAKGVDHMLSPPTLLGALEGLRLDLKWPSKGLSVSRDGGEVTLLHCNSIKIDLISPPLERRSRWG